MLFRRRSRAGSGAGSVSELSQPKRQDTSLDRLKVLSHARNSTGYMHSGNETVNERLVGQLHEADKAGNDHMFDRHAKSLVQHHSEVLRTGGYSSASGPGAKAHLEGFAGVVAGFAGKHSANSQAAHLHEVRTGYAANNPPQSAAPKPQEFI